MDISELLAFVVKNKASDLHLSAGLPPMIRVHGDVRRINLPPMEHKDVHGMIYDIMNDGQRKFYEENLECDFSFAIPGLARFRVNAFVQNRGAGARMRPHPSNVETPAARHPPAPRHDRGSFVAGTHAGTGANQLRHRVAQRDAFARRHLFGNQKGVVGQCEGGAHQRQSSIQLASTHHPSLRSDGNRITSRMLGLSVISIISRSMPMPQPPVGGMPYSSARM